MNERELLFTEVLDCTRTELYTGKGLSLDKKQSRRIARALKRRVLGEPLQYILGRLEFMGLEFKLNPDVFIPRPETEILVEKVIDIAHSAERIADRLNLLEIGTGSGCIAVSLAKLLPNAKITATDISERALQVARENARLNNVEARITFLKSDVFTHNAVRRRRYDLIISNPPYVASDEIDQLQPEVQREPRIALDGGRDGLDFYRRIVAEAAHHLKTSGLLILELGFRQRDAVESLLRDSGDFKVFECVKDYNQ
ncbi:peptide chain release factor N(5)-glutamine methyltransferase, partial [Candidatus Omnitrophota bacterium]